MDAAWLDGQSRFGDLHVVMPSAHDFEFDNSFLISAHSIARWLTRRVVPLKFLDIIVAKGHVECGHCVG